MRPFRSIPTFSLLLLVFGMSSPLDSYGQQSSSREGVVVRTNWPDMVYETDGAMQHPDLRAAEHFSDTELLPFLDTLSVSYTYDVRDGQPHIAFGLRWVPGDRGVLDGRSVTVDQLPDEIELAMIDLSARVYVAGEPVGTLLLTLDSLAAPPSPFEYTFSTADVTWDDVFADISAPDAREAFDLGFELRELDVLRIAFESFEPEVIAEKESRDVPVVRRQPRRRAIFVPDVGIWIGWNIGPDPYGGRPSRRSGSYRPRGDRVGRSDATDTRRTRGGRTADSSPAATGSASTSSTSGTDTDSKPSRGVGRAAAAAANAGKADKKKDDDDNDRDLLGPALLGVAAVGALAYLGGTVGYYGDASRAPIGLQAGRVTARGGFLLHAAVSPDVLQGGSDERLLVGLNVVWKPMLRWLHPMAGLDVWIENDGTSQTGEPSFTLGALVRTPGPLVFNVAYDVIHPGVQFGAAFNFRWRQLAR